MSLSAISSSSTISSSGVSQIRKSSISKEWLDFGSNNAIIADLSEPNPRIYWVDLLVSAAIGWSSLALTRVVSVPVGLVLAWVAALALYRCLVFTHELSHLKAGKLPGFRLAWNLLCGFPCMLPSEVYEGPHGGHHSLKHYGTDRDPRYLPLAGGARAALVVPLLVFAFVPALLAIRFLAIAPISWFVPRLRSFVLRRLSTLELNLAYDRECFDEASKRRMFVQELACQAYLLAALLGFVLGIIPGSCLAYYYFALYAILAINHIRALAAHHYLHREGSTDRLGQLLDSITIDSNRLDALAMAPLGLRFHSLHHLFPHLPYHALPIVHRHLKAALPSEHPYLRTLESSLWRPLGELWKGCTRAF